MTLAAISAVRCSWAQHLYRQCAELHGLCHCREAGVKMPGFFGYMLWSGAILLPLFVVVGWLFFAGNATRLRLLAGGHQLVDIGEQQAETTKPCA